MVPTLGNMPGLHKRGKGLNWRRPRGSPLQSPGLTFGEGDQISLSVSQSVSQSTRGYLRAPGPPVRRAVEAECGSREFEVL
jgi:hypothetical protein